MSDLRQSRAKSTPGQRNEQILTHLASHNDFDSNYDQIGEELLEDKDKQINSSDHKIAVKYQYGKGANFHKGSSQNMLNTFKSMQDSGQIHSYQIFERFKCNLLQTISKRSRQNAQGTALQGPAGVQSPYSKMSSKFSNQNALRGSVQTNKSQNLSELLSNFNSVEQPVRKSTVLTKNKFPTNFKVQPQPSSSVFYQNL